MEVQRANFERWPTVEEAFLGITDPPTGKPEVSILIVYHAGCPDGFVAALIAKTFFESSFVLNTEISKYVSTVGFEPISYGNALLSDVTDKVVFVLDFSFSLPMLRELKKRAKKIVILDHHATAMNELKEEEDCFFNLDFCGAMLAYRYFGSPEGINLRLIEYVQDQDLWKWELPHSEEINLALETFKFDFDVWKRLFDPRQMALGNLVDSGKSVLSYRRACVDRCIDHVHWTRWMGYSTVAVINTATFSNEISDTLLKSYEACALCLTWYYNHGKKKCKVSLRSSDKRPKGESVDVGKICKLFGGGGHYCAGGFWWPGCDVESLLEDPRFWDLHDTRKWLEEIDAHAAIPSTLEYNLTVGIWFQMYSFGMVAPNVPPEVKDVIFDNLEKRWSHLFSDHQLVFMNEKKERKKKLETDG